MVLSYNTHQARSSNQIERMRRTVVVCKYFHNSIVAQVAEWSKAVRSGRIISLRRFESCLVHNPFAAFIGCCFVFCFWLYNYIPLE